MVKYKNSIILHGSRFLIKKFENLLRENGFLNIKKVSNKSLKNLKLSKNHIIISMVDMNKKLEFKDQLFLNYLVKKSGSKLLSMRKNKYGVSIGPLVMHGGICLNCVKEEIMRFNSINYKSKISETISEYIGQILLLNSILLTFQKRHNALKNKMIHVFGENIKIYYDFVFKKPFCEVCMQDV